MQLGKAPSCLYIYYNGRLGFPAAKACGRRATVSRVGKHNRDKLLRYDSRPVGLPVVYSTVFQPAGVELEARPGRPGGPRPSTLPGKPELMQLES